MLMEGSSDISTIGSYRIHEDPMQVVSGPSYKRVVHFEAPPSKRMPAEMHRFMDWFNDTAPKGNAPLPALTRAGIAHLYFVCIHPFEDGNGRIGRAIAEKCLAQNLGHPSLAGARLYHRAQTQGLLRSLGTKQSGLRNHRLAGLFRAHHSGGAG